MTAAAIGCYRSVQFKLQGRRQTMTDPTLVGRTGRPFRVVVEEGKIREFARAVGASHLEHAGPAAIVPPTFLMTATFWQTPECSVWHGVERDLRRLLHGEQEFTFHGPPPSAGTELTAQERIDSVSTKQGKRGGEMTFTTVVTEFRDSTARLVAESRTTTIDLTGSAGLQ
jgi:hypothetical protein